MTIDANAVRSRRRFLMAIAGAASGVVAASFAGAQRVLAAGNDGQTMVIGGNYGDVRSLTILENRSNAASVFAAKGSQGDAIEAASVSGAGLYASTENGPYAVRGYASAGDGVQGRSGSGTGVHGVAGSDVIVTRNYPVAVLGEAKLPAGVAILGNNQAGTGIAVGVQGTSDSPAGLATIGWARKGGTGLIGVANGTFPDVPAATGVYGNAAGGRGVVAAGGKAQVRLVPSSAATHPSSGALGDLFLDKTGRLWFCKGGTTWKQIA